MIFVCLFYLITCFGLSLTVEYKPHEHRDVLSALFTAVSILPRALGIQQALNIYLLKENKWLNECGAWSRLRACLDKL